MLNIPQPFRYQVGGWCLADTKWVAGASRFGLIAMTYCVLSSDGLSTEPWTLLSLLKKERPRRIFLERKPQLPKVKDMPIGMYLTCVKCNYRQEFLAPASEDEVVKRFCLKDGPPARCEGCCSCDACVIRNATNKFIFSCDADFNDVIEGGLAPVQYQ